VGEFIFHNWKYKNWWKILEDQLRFLKSFLHWNILHSLQIHLPLILPFALLPLKLSPHSPSKHMLDMWWNTRLVYKIEKVFISLQSMRVLFYIPCNIFLFDLLPNEICWLKNPSFNPYNISEFWFTPLIGHVTSSLIWVNQIKKLLHGGDKKIL
jgi:hypothetical protein